MTINRISIELSFYDSSTLIPTHLLLLYLNINKFKTIIATETSYSFPWCLVNV